MSPARLSLGRVTARGFKTWREPNQYTDQVEGAPGDVEHPRVSSDISCSALNDPDGGSTRCTSAAHRGSSCSTWIQAKSPTYGEQDGSAYNGHFGCTCHHPLFVFNQLGDLERCALRPGNVHNAESWRALLDAVVSRYRGAVKRRYFRGDAAFANPEVHKFLEAEGMGYVIRLPANRVLQDKIGYLLKRPVGRPPNEVRR